MFSGAKINSSLSPNSYPNKLKRHKAELLAKEESNLGCNQYPNISYYIC